MSFKEELAGTDRTFWGGKIEGINFSVNNGTLESAIRMLPASVKQAFYAASKRGRIQQRTWNNCAFNAGAKEIGNRDVNSVRLAAKAFGISETLVSRFIRAWDTYTPTGESAHRDLQILLERVGLFTDPDSPKVIYRKQVYKGTLKEAELIGQFRKEVENLDTEIDGWLEASVLLFETEAALTQEVSPVDNNTGSSS